MLFIPCSLHVNCSYYRPQRSCDQVYVFTRVCDSVHRGGLLGRPPKKEAQSQGDPPPEGGTPLPRRPRQEGGTPLAKETPLPRRPPKKETPSCQGDPPRRRPPSRPTPKGEIEGDQIQAHTQGGN